MGGSHIGSDLTNILYFFAKVKVKYVRGRVENTFVNAMKYIVSTLLISRAIMEVIEFVRVILNLIL